MYIQQHFTVFFCSLNMIHSFYLFFSFIFHLFLLIIQGKIPTGGAAALARLSPRKIQTLMKGKDIFFTMTKSNVYNSTIVAHSYLDMSSVGGVEGGLGGGLGVSAGVVDERAVEEMGVSSEKGVWVSSRDDKGMYTCQNVWHVDAWIYATIVCFYLIIVVIVCTFILSLFLLLLSLLI